MRSRSGNPLPTLMLTLPLVAIPLMAVFGVPQFVPVIASSVSEDDQKQERHKVLRQKGVGESIASTTLIAANSSHRLESTSEDSLNDLFRPSGHSRPESRPIHVEKTETVESIGLRPSLTAAHKDLSDLFGPDAETPNFVDLRPTDQATSHNQPLAIPASYQTQRASTTSKTSSSDGLTWRRAVQRLNELGIHKFRLEPGRDNGDFYFACEFSPDQDSRITRRFEAESSEPLQAVQLVLRQIDDWTRRR